MGALNSTVRQTKCLTEYLYCMFSQQLSPNNLIMCGCNIGKQGKHTHHHNDKQLLTCNSGRQYNTSYHEYII